MTEITRETTVIDGIAYVLPRGEGRPRWVRRIGAYGIGFSCRWTSLNIGVDLLKSGILVAIGRASHAIEPEDKPAPRKQSPKPEREKRAYRRRDMKAEG